MSLSLGLSIIKEVSEIDMQNIEPIMILEELSRWDLNAKDFFVIKNRDNIIVAFGRLYTIGNHTKELSSLWVDPTLRGQKIGIYISEQLIKDKKEGTDIFLATENSLGKYYELAGFKIIKNQDAPSKFEKTAEWAKANNIDFIIMKYIK